MNKIKFTFNSIEDAKIAKEALNCKVSYIYGAAITEILISAGDRKEAIELLNRQGLSYKMR